MIKFIRGKESQYSVEIHRNYLFFATDTNKLFLDGDSYSGIDLNTDENRVVENMSFDSSTNTITIFYTNNTTSTSILNIPSKTSDLINDSDFVDTNDMAIALQSTLRINQNVFRGTKQQFDADPNKNNYYLALIYHN